jgi:hypothetical protein
MILTRYEQVRPQMLKLIEDNRLDMVSLVLNRIVSLVDGSVTQCENLDKMLADMTDEFQILFFKLLAREKSDSFLEIAGNIPLFDKISDKVMRSLTL